MGEKGEKDTTPLGRLELEIINLMHFERKFKQNYNLTPYKQQKTDGRRTVQFDESAKIKRNMFNVNFCLKTTSLSHLYGNG